MRGLQNEKSTCNIAHPLSSSFRNLQKPNTMKTAFLTFAAAWLVGASAIAQTNAVATHFADYIGRDGVTEISVSGSMFRMMGALGQPESEGPSNGALSMADDITGFHMVLDQEAANPMRDLHAASGKLKNHFETLMSIRDKNDRMEMWISERDGVAEEFVLAAAHDNLFMVMSITGKIKLDDLGKLSDSVIEATQGNTFKGLKVDKSDFRLFPNPVSKGETCTIAIPENMLGSLMSVHDASGRNLESSQVNQIEKTLNLSQLQPGMYVVRLQKGDTEVTKKLVVQ